MKEDRVLRRSWWGTESNASFRSKKTAQLDLLVSRDLNQEWVAARRVVSVEKPGRKPNWLLDNNLCELM